MKYELRIKERVARTLPLEVRYNCIVEEKNFEVIKKRYENFIEQQKKSYETNNMFYDAILLIDLLDDNGDFIKVIQ